MKILLLFAAFAAVTSAILEHPDTRAIVEEERPNPPPFFPSSDESEEAPAKKLEKVAEDDSDESVCPINSFFDRSRDKCKPCTACPRHFFPKRLCSEYSDTHCRSCLLRDFSPEWRNACLPSPQEQAEMKKQVEDKIRLALNKKSNTGKQTASDESSDSDMSSQSTEQKDDGVRVVVVDETDNESSESEPILDDFLESEYKAASLRDHYDSIVDAQQQFLTIRAHAKKMEAEQLAEAPWHQRLWAKTKEGAQWMWKKTKEAAERVKAAKAAAEGKPRESIFRKQNDYLRNLEDTKRMIFKEQFNKNPSDPYRAYRLSQQVRMENGRVTIIKNDEKESESGSEEKADESRELGVAIRDYINEKKLQLRPIVFPPPSKEEQDIVNSEYLRDAEVKIAHKYFQGHSMGARIAVILIGGAMAISAAAIVVAIFVLCKMAICARRRRPMNEVERAMVNKAYTRLVEEKAVHPEYV